MTVDKRDLVFWPGVYRNFSEICRQRKKITLKIRMLGKISQGYIVLKLFRFRTEIFEDGRRENQSLGLIKSEKCHDSRGKASNQQGSSHQITKIMVCKKGNFKV